MKRPAKDGPFDGDAWPPHLTSVVVSTERDPSVFGYRMFGDLLQNYDFLHVMWLMLTGDLASESSRQLFEAALGCIAAVRVSEGPAHAGLIAKTCDARPASVVATTAVVCAEEAHHVVTGHEAWLAYLRGETRVVPAVAKAKSMGPGALHLRQRARDIGIELAWLDKKVTDHAAVLGCLVAAGLTRSDQLVTTWVLARLVGSNAEALATPPRQFKNYPVNLPPVIYEK